MKTKLLSVLKYLFFLAAGVGLLWLAFHNFDLAKIYERIRNAHFGWVGLSMGLSFFAFVSRAHRWNMLIKPLGYKPSLKNSTCSLMVGYFANFAIPRIGEVTRCAMLGRAEKIPVDVLIGTVIAERVIDVLTLLFFMILLVVLQFKKIGGFLLEKFVTPILDKLQNNFLLLSVLSIGVLLVIGFALYFLFRSEKDKKDSPLKLKIKGLVQNIWTGLKTVIRLENNWAFLFHTLVIWTLYFSVSYLCFFATDATSNLGVTEGLYTLVVGGVGMSMPVQGGIGTFHWIVSEGLTLYGVAQEDGLIYATIVHASQSIFIIVLGGISYFILLFSKKTGHE